MKFSASSFLRDRRDEIVAEWESLVTAEPRDLELRGEVLRNTLSEFLTDLAAWLEGDEPPGTGTLRSSALKHVIERLDKDRNSIPGASTP